MIDRWQQELKLVEVQYGKLEISENWDWFIIKQWSLVPGWSKGETMILILIPSGYPTTPPDNFYTDNDLCLAGGGQPGNSSPNQNQVGGQWRQFSYHVESGDWQPHAEPLKGHNFLTFLQGVARRLSEVS